MVDLVVRREGSFVTFALKSMQSVDFVKELVQLEDYQWIGNNEFVVDCRMAPDIIDGMLESGLVVAGWTPRP